MSILMQNTRSQMCVCGMSSPLGCTPTVEQQRPGNFHSRAHTPWQLLGLGQTLEGDIIVTVGTCQVGQGRKIQVSRVSIEPNKCSNDIGRIGGGEGVAAFTESEVHWSRQETTGEFRGTVLQGKELSDARREGPCYADSTKGTVAGAWNSQMQGRRAGR